MSGHSKWANIKHKKGKVDAIRGQVTTKIAREITVAVKLGGSDPTGNMRLKLALAKAKANNIPKDNIQRAVQKGAGAGDGASYEEIIYEGYGPGGTAVFLEAMTDNRNRTAADIRHLFAKNGGNLGENGCVGWMFKQKGIFTVEKAKGVDEETLMMIALEAGAEDIAEQDGQFEITADPANFEAIEKALEQNKITPSSASIAMIPDTTVALTGDEAVKMLKLMEALEEHDDVQEVYANFEIPDDLF